MKNTKTRMRLARCTFVAALAISACATQAEEHSLVLGVFPRFNASDTTARYTPLAEHLGVRLGREIRLVTAKDFPSFWQGVEEKRYDIVQYNQYHYIRSSRDYQVIAHNEEFGKSTIAGAIYVRKDSGITDLKQLKGRTVLFGGGEDAMISYIAPMYLMLQAGLKKNDITARFAVNPLNSVIGVYHRQADAAGSGDIVIGQPALKNAVETDQLTALAVSEQLLSMPWAVKRSMRPALREEVQGAMIGLDQTKAGQAALKSALLTGIGKAEDKDYEPHRKMVRAVVGAM